MVSKAESEASKAESVFGVTYWFCISLPLFLTLFYVLDFNIKAFKLMFFGDMILSTFRLGLSAIFAL